MTKVVHFRKESFDILIMRPSKWGNPFIIDKDGDRPTVLYKYWKWIQTQPELLAAIPLEIKDKVLACCCFQGDARGDILAALADGTPLPDYIQDWEGFCQKYGVENEWASNKESSAH
jgi:hypothetical protein